jgi:hypothetical protein
MYSAEEKLEEVTKVMEMTRGWLASFGNGSKAPRPHTEIETKQRRLDVMKALRDDLERAVERKRGAA